MPTISRSTRSSSDGRFIAGKLSLRETLRSLWPPDQRGGFVILDYEELGAFCNQECGDRRFRSYLCEAPDDDTL